MGWDNGNMGWDYGIAGRHYRIMGSQLWNAGIMGSGLGLWGWDWDYGTGIGIMGLQGGIVVLWDGNSPINSAFESIFVP